MHTYQDEPFSVESRHEDLDALVLLADHVFGGDLAVLKGQLARVGPAHAELVQLGAYIWGGTATAGGATVRNGNGTVSNGTKRNGAVRGGRERNTTQHNQASEETHAHT